MSPYMDKNGCCLSFASMDVPHFILISFSLGIPECMFLTVFLSGQDLGLEDSHSIGVSSMSNCFYLFSTLYIDYLILLFSSFLCYLIDSYIAIYVVL